MTRKAYDSTTARDTPKGGDLYLGYEDGNYVNTGALTSRHPGHLVVGITVNGSAANLAKMADIEAGNMGAATGARIALAAKRSGTVYTLYFPASMRRTVAAECRKLGLKTPSHLRGWNRDVLFFPAQYDGKAKIPRWAVGKQYLHGDAGHPGAYSGGHYDVSVVRDYWPGVDPKPKPKPSALSRRSAYLASRLAKRLSNRTHPLDGESKVALTNLLRQITRVLDLKG